MEPKSIQQLFGAVDGSKTSKAQKPSGQGVAFRALLDGLEKEAAGLSESSESLQDSKGLANAVGQSERAIEQARALTDQLLEALRADQTRTGNIQAKPQ
ncbi:MAG: hypothetical protein KDB61_10365 [Planctomycetes bacterium]|nr:hypothetical protein [Planctomycetota bacterium]